MNMLKSIGAVLAGFISVFVLSVATDVVLEKTGIFPGATHPELYAQWMFAVALLYRCLYAVAGGYTTARIAPNKPMRHVLILAITGTILGTLGTIANWSKTTPGTQWYPILLIVLSFPSVWFGGKFKIMKLKGGE